MGTTYLDKLNDRQRQAVEFGAGVGLPPPLLIIAGAGSGKTNTLAHRVGAGDGTSRLRCSYQRHLGPRADRRIPGHQPPAIAHFIGVDLLQLEQIAAGYPSRERFLTDLTLDPPDATGGQAGVPLKDDDYLILSTIHSAKGQEWRAVFVLNVVDGCIPSDLGTGSSAEIEEERRLLYVAMTRAKDQLTLGVPLRFAPQGRTHSVQRCASGGRAANLRVRWRMAQPLRSRQP